MIYTVETVLTRPFYDDMFKRWYREKVLKPFAFYGLGFVAFFLAALGFHDLGWRGDRGFISGFYVASLCAYLIWFFSITKQSKQRFYTTCELHIGQSVQYQLNDEGITLSGEQNESFYAWSRFVRLKENDVMWTLHLTEWDGVALPTEKLTDEMKRFIKSNLFN